MLIPPDKRTTLLLATSLSTTPTFRWIGTVADPLTYEGQQTHSKSGSSNVESAPAPRKTPINIDVYLNQEEAYGTVGYAPADGGYGNRTSYRG